MRRFTVVYYRKTFFFKLFIFAFFALGKTHNLHSQLIQAFNTRYTTNQKGGIRILANVSASCSSGTSCTSATSQVPPSGTNQNGDFTMNYVDIDGLSSTFMSSSDSLNLANCSEILWAGLYWGARATSSVSGWSSRSSCKIRVNSGSYQTLTADQTIDAQSLGTHPSYYCFKDITSIVNSAGIRARFTVADVVTQTGGGNLWGGWSIIVVYKNVFQSMRNLSVFDGFANVGIGNSVDIPISGFTTPPSGPVSFELGVVSYEGDRGSTGDQLQFNGNGTFINVFDALHPTNDFFNSTISNLGTVTTFRNPSLNNTLGLDASTFSPTNTSFNYIGNNASSATIRITTSSENILARAVTSAIDIYEPDLRADVRVSDIDGGTIDPGDILEYTVVGKNIGSDLSLNTYLENTIDDRVDFVPGSISVTYGPNLGSKTDATGDDQGEYNSTTRKIRVRVGTGANGTTGGQMLASSTGADSTVIKFRVKVKDECMMFQCNPTIYNVAYIYGKGNISGNDYNNNGLSDTYNSQGCPVVLSNALTINVSGCPTTTINYPTTCANSSLQLSTTYSVNATYNWSGPNGFTSNIHNPVINPATSSNSGIYTLTVSFASLTCSLTLSKLVIIRPLPTINQSSLNHVTCFGQNNGSVQISASGATSPYNYLWSNGSTSTSLSNLGPGTYSVTVTDNFGCQNTASYTITEPPVLTASASITSNYNGRNISCNGAADGAATVTISGGTAPYSISWSNGATTQNISNLGPGTYTATITDSRGCTTSSSVTLTQPAAVSLSDVHLDVSCNGGTNGSITLSISGGTSPYTYLWSNAATTQNLSNIPAGTYNVTAKDVNNCTRTRTVIITQPTALVLSRTVVNVNCFGQNTGSIDLTVSGGTSPYNYSWSNSSTNEDLTNLLAGDYTVTVTDNKQCQQILLVTITQPNAALSTQLTAQNINCSGDTTGSISSTTIGGTPPYFYSWSNNATSQNIQGLAAGFYSLTVTDSKGCQTTSNATLTQPLALNLVLTGSNVTCYGLTNGSVSSSLSGGTAPFNYSWSNGETGANLSNLSAGNYFLTITDFNNCQISRNIVITAPLAPLSISSVKTNISCAGQTTGIVDITVNGGTPNYTFQWNNGVQTEDLNAIGAGIYTVIVTDSQGCQATKTDTLTEPSTALVVALSGNNLTCNGNLSGSVNSTVSGGSIPYSYSWSNSANSPDLVNVAAGTYTLTVTDAAGCQKVASQTITQPAVIALSDVRTPVSCRFG
ncbi:MAG: hypothetical protein RL264_2613, partial [Bacteroidota bacterium]